MKSPDQLPKSPESFKFQIGEATVAHEAHPERNEDALLSVPQQGVFAVFDGVGGRAAGYVASNMAKDYLKNELLKIPEDFSFEDRKNKIEAIFKDVHENILKLSNKSQNLSEMATTVSFVQFCKGTDGLKKIIAVNAGDSRVYIFRNSKLEQITVDDNGFNPELQVKFDNVVEEKDLTDTERISWKDRRLITNALGWSEFEPKINVFNLQPDDIIIITSDGIHDNLTSQEIANAVSGKEGNSVKAKRLVEAARQRSRERSFRSKPDDMTALVVGEQI